MRIDAYMQVNQLYNTNTTKSKVNATKSDNRDSYQVSSFGSAYQVAKKAAVEAASQGADVRMDKVNEIKEKMTAGTYRVPIEDVADKLAEQLTL